jgi:phospholipid/cholesterol/gamma-HCH transport system permease protein
VKDSHPSAGRCRLASDGEGPVLHLSGRWLLEGLGALDDGLRTALGTGAAPAGLRLDGSELVALDTAAALLLWRRLGLGQGGEPPACRGFDPRFERILMVVAERVAEVEKPHSTGSPSMLALLGAGASGMGAMLASHVGYLGLTVTAIAGNLLHPGRMRWRELSAQLSQTGVTAIPVIILVTFLIGLIMAYLLGQQATQFGANIFVVDGVALGMVREFSPLIVAVIVAGRSGAAFTAQLGTMKLTEEIDAIRTLGLSAEQVLIVPRVLGLMVVLPLLVFVGDVASMVGAMFVADLMLDITPSTFIDRLREALALKHVVIGLAKAPLFALVIGVIGCAMGMSVSRDTRSIGINTTSTVVQSIVAVILLDAVIAVLLQEIGL